MDIFQLIGDMLHLIACLILLLKIIATRNVIGIELLINYRTVIQNSGNLCCRVFDSLRGYVFGMEIYLFVCHENCLHSNYHLYGLPDEISKTFQIKL